MRTYVDLTGQDDNLGDAVLRRGLLNAIHNGTADLRILAGGASASYISALHIGSGHLTLSQRDWIAALTRSTARRRAHLVLNAGETLADSEQNFAKPRVLAAAAAVRLGGGAVLHTGRGLRASTSERNAGAISLGKLTSLTTWRDHVSARRAKSPRVEPDWAFATGTGGLGNVDRDTIAITLRGDRGHPNEKWMRLVAESIRSTGARPVLFTQVRRDNSMARVLGEETGYEVDIWQAEHTHRDREGQLRDLFARSIGVISDRVHALILGATEGAVPIGLAPTSDEKLKRTLEGGGLMDFTMSSQEAHALEKIQRCLRRSPSVSDAVLHAESRLLQLASEARGHLHG